MSPLNLARESFEVIPSKRRTATAQASNNFVLSKNIGSGSKDKIVYVQQLRIRMPAPLPPESSQEVQVIERVEVESQDLPKTCNWWQLQGYCPGA
jgi:hypothetical protein